MQKACTTAALELPSREAVVAGVVAGRDDGANGAGASEQAAWAGAWEAFAGVRADRDAFSA